MGKNRKILIIDDDAYIRRVIEFKLKKQGYEVMMATNGEEGLDLIQSQRPDVVITDILMPKLDGRSLCEQTNVLKDKRSFLTIVMTNRISPEDRKWVKEMCHTQFMEKPFSPSKLAESIDQYFEMQES